MRMIKKLNLVIFFLIFFGLISSCIKKPMNKADNQILRINYNVDLQSFQPYLVSDVRTHTVCKALYEGLTRINLQGKVEFAAAEKVSISPCKKIYTFTLRPSVWSNGQKVTAQYFVKAWEKAISSDSKCIHVKRFFLIKNAKKFYQEELPFDKVGIKAPSNNTLIIELEHPAPYLLQLVADPIYSPIYNPDEKGLPNVFNGPFVIEHHEFNKQLTLSANPLYWDKATVTLKKIEISFIKDAQTAFFMYKNNQFDYIGSPFTNIPEDIIPTLSNIKFRQASAPFWMFFNVQNPKFKSSKIRRALAYAINREDIINHVIPNQKEVMYTILPKDITATDLEPLLKNINVEKAQKLFEAGLRELKFSKENFQITINHSSSSEQRKISLYLKHQWEKIFGIKIHLKMSDWNSFFSKLLSGDYEIGGSFNCNIFNDSSYFMETFQYSHSNYSKWENENYKNNFNLSKNCIDEKQRKKYLKAAEEVLLDEMPVIPIYNHTHLYICNESLINFSPPKFNCSDFKWVYFRIKNQPIPQPYYGL